MASAASPSEFSPREAETFASMLAIAARRRVPVAALSLAQAGLSVEAAYDVQHAGVRQRVAEGARVIGYKLGFTSAAKQAAMGIHEPIYGTLLDGMRLAPGEALDRRRLIHPKAEPEVAFVLGRALAGSAVTAAEVLEATASLHAALDVLDSRYVGFKFQLADVIADNASGAAFVLGPPVAPVGFAALAALGAEFRHNDRLAARGTGRDVMGHPAEAVAWLVRALAVRNLGLRAGDVVLSGALVAPIDAGDRDVFEARLEALGSVALRVEGGA